MVLTQCAGLENKIAKQYQGKQCHCGRQCVETCLRHQMAIAKELVPIANARKTDADALLVPFLQKHAPASSTDAAHFSIAGVRVCKDTLLTCLGIHPRRAGRIEKGHVDMRCGPRGHGGPRGRDRTAYLSIFGFLWHSS